MADSTWLTLGEKIEEILQASFGTTSGATHTIDDDSFYVLKFPWNSAITHPACFITPVPERFEDAEHRRDDHALGAQVTITQESNRSLTTNHDRLHWWRERAIAEFLNQRIGGLPQYHKVKIEPNPIIDPVPFLANYDATAFVIRATYRKTRPTQAA